MTYQNTAHRATASRDLKRDAFAAAAVREVFRPRDLRLANEPDFADRQPGRAPQRLDDVAEAVAEDLGRAALRHWLSQAAQAENLEERQAAQEIAREIARLAGIPFKEPFGREAA